MKKRNEKKIKIDIKKYNTGYLMKHFQVTRQTIANWKKSSQIPIKYFDKVLELIKGG